MQKKFGKKDFIVVAVNGWDEPKEVVARYVATESLEQTVLLMGGETASEKFGVRAYPTTFLLDASGKILSRDIGFDESIVPEKEATIAALIREKSQAKPPE